MFFCDSVLSCVIHSLCNITDIVFQQGSFTYMEISLRYQTQTIRSDSHRHSKSLNNEKQNDIK